MIRHSIYLFMESQHIILIIPTDLVLYHNVAQTTQIVMVTKVFEPLKFGCSSLELL